MKKLITALFAAALLLILPGCGTDENPAGDEKSPPMVENSPIQYSPDDIPDGAEYLTICRTKSGGTYKIKSDENTQRFYSDELEDACYYISRGENPELLTGTSEGELVFDDNGLLLVYSDGRTAELPFDSEKLDGAWT